MCWFELWESNESHRCGNEVRQQKHCDCAEELNAIRSAKYSHRRKISALHQDWTLNWNCWGPHKLLQTCSDSLPTKIWLQADMPRTRLAYAGAMAFSKNLPQIPLAWLHRSLVGGTHRWRYNARALVKKGPQHSCYKIVMRIKNILAREQPYTT